MGGYYVQGLLLQFVTAVSFELFRETNAALHGICGNQISIFVLLPLVVSHIMNLQRV
jgi:hypothetical protein